jgi:hypothetical protein
VAPPVPPPSSGCNAWPATGIATEPDWQRAMSTTAGTPSIGPIVGIFGFSDCLGTESRNYALRQKRADAVLALFPSIPKTKVMMTHAELTGNFLSGNDTAEQRAHHGTPDIGLRLDMTLSDALLDYYVTTKTTSGRR